MIAVLQWVALGLCLASAIWRLPAAVKGRNAGVFWVFILLALAVGLSLPAIYLPVDGVLGGRNIANLLLRFALYAIFYILATKVAAAYRAPRSERLIRGPIGLGALIFVSVGTVVTFLLSDLPVSSAGLAGYDQFTVSLYVVAGRLYPAYAAACLIWPTAQAVRSSGLRTERAAAGIICASFCMVVLLTVLQLATFRLDAPMAILTFMNLISYAAIIFLAVGLALIWISVRTQRRRAARGALAKA